MQSAQNYSRELHSGDVVGGIFIDSVCGSAKFSTLLAGDNLGHLIEFAPSTTTGLFQISPNGHRTPRTRKD